MKPSPKSPTEIDPTALGETRINQEAIGARLRQLYDEVVNEPVPEEFLAILRKGDERESRTEAPEGDAPEDPANRS